MGSRTYKVVQYVYVGLLIVTIVGSFLLMCITIDEFGKIEDEMEMLGVGVKIEEDNTIAQFQFEKYHTRRKFPSNFSNDGIVIT